MLNNTQNNINYLNNIAFSNNNNILNDIINKLQNIVTDIYSRKQVDIIVNQLKNIIIIINNIMNENKNNINYLGNKIDNLSNKINNFQQFKNNYEKLKGSIISKEFVGYLGIIDFCEHCYQDNKITFKTFETLSFHIDDIIKKIKNNCLGIYQCFKYYVRQENMICNKCKLKKYKRCDLWHMPSTLIITLDYGNNTKAKLIFEEFLNLTQFVTYIKESPNYYELVGIIVNLEKNQNGNHYISYCKNSNNCLWYKYDNDIVVRSSFIDVASHDQPSALFFSYVET